MGAKAVIVNGKILTKRNITEVDLIRVETARAHEAILKHALAQATRVRQEAEHEVVSMLEAGYKVVGSMSAMIVESVGARRPPWKDVYLDHMENAHNCSRDVEEIAILDGTVGKPTQELVIGIKKGRGQ